MSDISLLQVFDEDCDIFLGGLYINIAYSNPAGTRNPDVQSSLATLGLGNLSQIGLLHVSVGGVNKNALESLNFLPKLQVNVLPRLDYCIRCSHFMISRPCSNFSTEIHKMSISVFWQVWFFLCWLLCTPISELFRPWKDDLSPSGQHSSICQAWHRWGDESPGSSLLQKAWLHLWSHRHFRLSHSILTKT